MRWLSWGALVPANTFFVLFVLFVFEQTKQTKQTKQTVAIESSGAIDPQSRAFLRELGRRVQLESSGTNSTMYLLQRLLVAVQRGNAVAIMGSLVPANSFLFCLFCLFSVAVL